MNGYIDTEGCVFRCDVIFYTERLTLDTRVKCNTDEGEQQNDTVLWSSRDDFEKALLFNVGLSH